MPGEIGAVAKCPVSLAESIGERWGQASAAFL